MSMQPTNADKPGGLNVGGVTIPPRVAGGGVILVLAIIFILQNRNDIKITFLWFHTTAPLWLWLTIMFVAGAAVGAIAARNRIRRKALERQAAGAG